MICKMSLAPSLLLLLALLGGVAGQTVLKITTALNHPYVIKEGGSLKGYAIDLGNEIARHLDVTVDFQVADKYGAKDNETGKWTGMMGKLISGEADLAIADLTITANRAEAVDFSLPFMNLGLGLLLLKPGGGDDSCIFGFLAPLTLDLWVYMVGTYVITSLALYILARVSPYETSSESAKSSLTNLDDEFSLVNSFWYTFATLFQQKTNLAPRATSTRIVVGVWWMLTLILISVYTANLAAFLSVERMETLPINSPEDLTRQTRIKYGSFCCGSTRNFFKNSKIETYRRMNADMESSPGSIMTQNNREGVEKVLNGEGEYAYIMETPAIEYEMARNCLLTTIGSTIGEKSYGVAMPKNSEWRDRVNQAILTLQETDTLELLKEKWWSGNGGANCNDQSGGNSSSQLGTAQVGGVFIVFLVGLAAAAAAACAELAWSKVMKKDGFQPTQNGS